MLAELAKYVRMQDIKVIFASHQDPDICSSLAMWLDLNPSIKTYCSWLWTGFVSHFSTGAVIMLNPIPDDGMRIKIGEEGRKWKLFQPITATLRETFPCTTRRRESSFRRHRVGLVPNHEASLVVTDFDQHIQYMRGFPSPLDAVDHRAPRMGPTGSCDQAEDDLPAARVDFPGEHVGKLLDWLESLEVGQWKGSTPKSDTRAAA